MKRIETNTWCYSWDGESFESADYATREEAIEAARKDGGTHIGRAVKVEFDENDIIYDETSYYLEESLSEEVGEIAENWEMTNEQDMELCKILAKVVIDYINKNDLQPTCFAVTDIEEVQK